MVFRVYGSSRYSQTSTPDSPVNWLMVSISPEADGESFCENKCYSESHFFYLRLETSFQSTGLNTLMGTVTSILDSDVFGYY